MRKLVTFLMSLFAAVVLSAPALAQTYIPVTASSIQDAQGNMLANGTWCAVPTDNLDRPIFIKVGISGLAGNALSRSVCAIISNGAITGPLVGTGTFQLANPALSYPTNVRYRVTITDTDSGTNWVYKGVSITANSGSNFLWDIYLYNGGSVPAPNWAYVGAIEGLGSDGANGITVLGGVSSSGLTVTSGSGSNTATLRALSTIPSSWTIDLTSPLTALASIGGPSGCVAWRGQVNPLDCGAPIPNGTFVIGGCANTSPNGCFAGADETPGIRAAISSCANAVATGSGGCTVLLPNAGTNMWMVGASASATDECILDAQTGYYGIFNLPNGVTIQGQGRWITTLMAQPGTAQARTCAMFQNTAAIPIGITLKGLRMDGNEGTNSSHTDWLHPNNNFGTSTNFLMGLNFNGTQQSGPALSMTDFVISGFPGSGADGPLINASSLLGGNIYVEFSDGSIIFNEYGTFVLQLADSTFDSIKWQNNGSWNAFDGLDVYNGGSTFTANYFGGGSYGTAQVNLMCDQGSRFISGVFDNTGGAQLALGDSAAGCSGFNTSYTLVANSTFSQPGNGGNSSTSTTNSTIGTGSKTFTTGSGAGYYTGEPILIVDSGAPTNYETGFVTSYSSTTLVANITATYGSGTFATWSISGSAPFILVGGHSTENIFTGNYCNTGPLGHSTFCVQETGSTSSNNYTGFIVSPNSPPGIGAFALSSTSQACATIGANNVNCGGTNPIYRCTTAGTLPVGALTTVTGNCGASVITNQWSK